MIKAHEMPWTPQEYSDYVGVPHIIVPTAIFIDWDRTAGAINEVSAGMQIGAMPRLLAAAALWGIDPEEILAEQVETEKTQPYDAYDAIQTRFGDTPGGKQAFTKLREHFTSSCKELPNSVYPDTSPFLRALSKARIPHGIYTAGQNPEWQADKVASGKFKGYVEIVPMFTSVSSDGRRELKSPAKGPIMAATRTSETYDFVGTTGGREIAVFSAKNVILIDDKIESANDIPVETGKALIIRRPGETVSARQAGELPQNASIISELPNQAWIDAHSPKPGIRRIERYVPLAAL